jgi:hypothetical protein
MEVWDQQWTTLTAFREDGKVQYTQDQWKPHFLLRTLLQAIFLV